MVYDVYLICELYLGIKNIPFFHLKINYFKIKSIKKDKKRQSLLTKTLEHVLSTKA